VVVYTNSTTDPLVFKDSVSCCLTIGTSEFTVSYEWIVPEGAVPVKVV